MYMHKTMTMTLIDVLLENILKKHSELNQKIQICILNNAQNKNGAKQMNLMFI